MAHHKRGRAKNQRSGCLLCKSFKANGAKDKNKPRLADALLNMGEEIDECLSEHFDAEVGYETKKRKNYGEFKRERGTT